MPLRHFVVTPPPLAQRPCVEPRAPETVLPLRCTAASPSGVTEFTPAAPLVWGLLKGTHHVHFRVNEMRNGMRLEDLITDFREMLPAQCATAQAIDQGEPWEQIALRAMEDGYIEVVEQFDSFVEICLQREA